MGKKNKPLTEVKATSNLEHESDELNSLGKNKTHTDLTAGLGSLFESDQNVEPKSAQSSSIDKLSSDTSALYDELDTFRRKWRRELEVTEDGSAKSTREHHETINISPDGVNAGRDLPDENVYDYEKSKKLFLKAVEMEQGDLHHESIQFYKQSMQICPDIEKRIFREQCGLSSKVESNSKQCQNQVAKTRTKKTIQTQKTTQENCDNLSILDRIKQSHFSDPQVSYYPVCKPASKLEPKSKHLSHLPHELLLKIVRWVVGEELDLSSFQQLGMVSRGFYLLSRNSSIWRSICFSTWGESTLSLEMSKHSGDDNYWFKMFRDRPRININGVYSSKTRYIRVGDSGFQDMTYRPFHVVRYYRYLRFFPGSRVLILTTNEDPEKIIPIFRNAKNLSHFSPDLSALEGTYEMNAANEVTIVAEKDSRNLEVINRRQNTYHWSRQTPRSQKFCLKLQLETNNNKQYKNNSLRWIEYSILSRLETGQETTTFDINQDTFPDLAFSRVKQFNYKTCKPLLS